MKYISWIPVVLVMFCLMAGFTVTSKDAHAASYWDELLARLEQDGFRPSDLQKLFHRSGMNYDPAPMRGKLRVLQKKYFGSYRTRLVQQGLAKLGYAVGKVDGAYGLKTANALKSYQKARGLSVDGVPSDAVLDSLARDLKQTRKSGWSGKVYQAVRSPARLAEAREFVIAHWPVFYAMNQRYDVPWEIVAGILTIETRVGHFLGTRSPLVTLASMASCNDLDCAGTFFRKGSLSSEEQAWLKKTVRQRSDWAYDELKALLTYCARNKLDPLNMPGSIYGAFGIGQFMPSSVLRFGVDGDNDGDVDLFSVPDAVYSVGAYLHGHGWKGDMRSLDKKREVLFAYNHSQQYVNSILKVAEQMADAFALPDFKTGSQRTVRVSDMGSFVQSLASNTKIYLEPGKYDLNSVRGFANQNVRCGTSAEGLLLELRGLRNVSIRAERGALLTAGGKGLSLRIADTRGLALDGLQLESGANSAALVEFHQVEDVLMTYCRLQGGGFNCEKSRRITLANSLLHALQMPGVQLQDTQSVSLRNMVIRSANTDKLLVVSNSSGLEVANCYFHDNGESRKSGTLFEFLGGGTGSVVRDSCLMDNSFAGFSNKRGLPRSSNNYLKGNTFKVR